MMYTAIAWIALAQEKGEPQKQEPAKQSEAHCPL